MSSLELKLTLAPSRSSPTERFANGLGVAYAEAVEQHEKRRPPVEERFGEWMDRVRHLGSDKDWKARHFQLMQEVLDQVTAGEIRRVFFQVAIRHGKTEHNTIGYGAYRLEKNPRTRILVCSYNQQKASKFSREIRKLSRVCGVQLSEDRDAAGEWETTAGGGVIAAGAGTGLASVNADIIIIDDPVGSREEAESQAHRDRVWDWLTNDVLARCEPHTAVIFTMSRWHRDDPAGRLMKEQGSRWTVIDLPAEAEKYDPRQPDSKPDPLERQPGEALWPELRDKTWLQEKREELGAYGFASLLQGRPRPREGGMFKHAWWQYLGEVPLKGQMVRYWDLAGTEPKGKGHDPDFTAGALLCAMLDERTAIVDLARFRKSIASRDAAIIQVCESDLEKYRGRIRWWIEIEAGIAGEERTATLVRKIQKLGMAVWTEHPTGSKVLRAEPLASAAEAGNAVLVTGAWTEAFCAEAADFPNGNHDDQIDATAGGYAKISIPAGRWGTSTHRN